MEKSQTLKGQHSKCAKYNVHNRETVPSLDVPPCYFETLYDFSSSSAWSGHRGRQRDLKQRLHTLSTYTDTEKDCVDTRLKSVWLFSALCGRLEYDDYAWM